jgi:hypothetical protein
MLSENFVHRADKEETPPVSTVSQTAHRLARRLVLPRHLGRTIGGLIGTLSIRHVVLVGEMTAFGEPWLTAVRREAHRSALALLAMRPGSRSAGSSRTSCRSAPRRCS